MIIRTLALRAVLVPALVIGSLQLGGCALVMAGLTFEKDWEATSTKVS